MQRGREEEGVSRVCAYEGCRGGAGWSGRAHGALLLCVWGARALTVARPLSSLPDGDEGEEDA